MTHEKTGQTVRSQTENDRAKSMRPPLVALVAACALALGSLGAAFVALVPFAHAASDDDARIAEQLLAKLEVDPETRALTAEAVSKSRDALGRATRMRNAGDEAHARIAESLARDWAELGQDLVRAAETERRAEAARVVALDAGAAVDRERALLEEGIARLGRLRAQLGEADGAAREGGGVDGGRAQPVADGGSR